MFFVNVQSCTVLNACYLWIRYFVIQSRFLSTMPPFSCGYFLRDFHDFLYSHIRSCLSQHHYLTALHHRLLRSCNPAVVIFSLHRRFRCCDSEALAYFAAQIVTSQLTLSGTTHCCRLAVFYWLFDLTSGRLTVPSEPSSIANTAMHPHHRPSCILRAPHPSETHACRSPTTSSRSTLPPSALQPRLYGASHLKTPSAITASSTTSRRPRVHPALHHRLLVSALFAASFASSTSYASLSSAAIAGHSRAR